MKAVPGSHNVTTSTWRSPSTKKCTSYAGKATPSEGQRETMINNAKGEPKARILQAKARQQAALLQGQAQQQQQVLNAKGTAEAISTLAKTLESAPYATEAMQCFMSFKRGMKERELSRTRAKVQPF